MSNEVSSVSNDFQFMTQWTSLISFRQFTPRFVLSILSLTATPYGPITISLYN